MRPNVFRALGRAAGGGGQADRQGEGCGQRCSEARAEAGLPWFVSVFASSNLFVHAGVDVVVLLATGFVSP